MQSTDPTPGTALEVRTEAPASLTASPSLREAAGVHALGRLDEKDFEAQLATLVTGMKRLDRIIEEVLEEGSDIITIPGVKGKVLALPGAEKLDFMMRLVSTYAVATRPGQGTAQSPLIGYEVKCQLHLCDADGPVVAEAVGTANSNEPRYRYRKGQRECPECHKAGTLLRSKFDAKPPKAWAGKKGWYCYAAKDGCGVEFSPDDVRITDQRVGQVENPDPFELDNTICKIAQKRAHTSATKAATGGSARFTVDVEENPSAYTGNAREVAAEDVTDFKARTTEAAAAVDDMYRVPPGEAVPPRETRTRTEVMQVLVAVGKKAGYVTPTAMLKACSDALQRDLKSSEDLTFDEILSLTKHFFGEAT